MNLKSITLIELGVAKGEGLINLCYISSLFAKATGLKYKIYGFDLGSGLSEIRDFRDHPEIWSESMFEMGNKQELLEKINSFGPNVEAGIIFGNTKVTIPDFTKNVLSPDSPIGFICLDLDLYSSSKYSLPILTGSPDCYLPATLMYVDDCESLLTYNSRCGEKLAINEFNTDHKLRFIEKKLIRRNFVRKMWHERIYICHVLDHLVRTGEQKAEPFEINIEHC